MKLLHQLSIACLLVVFALVGCDDDPTAPEISNAFGGDWVLVSTITQKAVCLGGQTSDILIEEMSIDQDDQSLAIDFPGFSLSGTAVDGTLRASGTMPGGEGVSFVFTKNGSRLDGSVVIDGDGCQERRALEAHRRGYDANFGGHWGLTLSVMGESGCEFLDDYTDCFRILQTGRDLLVVDEEAGNLFGTVTGGIAEIERDTLAENTWLIFYMDASGGRMTGIAQRYFSEPGCRTDFEFVALERDEPCSNPKHAR
jgi:hypothetical protein